MNLTGEFASFYKSSQMRNGVLSWYPFEPDSRVLDATNNALTELLTSRCRELVTYENSTPATETFDYTVVLDPPQLDPTSLAQLRSTLSPSGRLLLATQNGMGIRTLAGHGTPERRALLTRADLARNLLQAGFAPDSLKWYYPLADHWLTTEVYSDGCLPNEYLNQRFVPYLDDDPDRRFDENLLWPTIIRNGLFPGLCNAFLIEARNDPSQPSCPVDYAAVNAYREPDRRYATVLNNDDTAYKIPLHPDAIAGLTRIAANHSELVALGVNALSCTVKQSDAYGPVLTMPRLNLPTLTDHWATQISEGTWEKNEVLRIFDRLDSDIHRAAQQGMCYWELVPANCFYDISKRDTPGELLYFDQEYTSPGVNPDLALARAVSGLRWASALADRPCVRRVYDELITRYGLITSERNMLYELANMDTYLEVFGREHRDYQLLSQPNAARFR